MQLVFGAAAAIRLRGVMRCQFAMRLPLLALLCRRPWSQPLRWLVQLPPNTLFVISLLASVLFFPWLVLDCAEN